MLSESFIEIDVSHAQLCFPTEAAEEDVGPAPSGDGAESSRAADMSGKKGILRPESKSPDWQRPHQFLADFKACLPITQASASHLKLFMLEADSFQMPTVGDGLLAEAGVSHIYENDGTFCADQLVQSIPFFRNSHLRAYEGRKLAPHGD